MKDYYSKIFSNTEPREDLLQSIFARIDAKRRAQSLQRHILIMVPFLMLVLGLSAYSVVLLKDTLSNSALFGYISLIFTDTSTVIENIGMFITLIAEAVPAFTLAVLLFSLFGLLKIAQYMLRDLGLLNEINLHKNKYANT